MKPALASALLILLAGLIYIVYGIVDEYLSPYKKVEVRTK